ncbi:MAG: hypothetical protein JO061_04860 [Acidobacteriaceae bacterium]|nr:hypothetical protein [Acidobacteriaceae bacterium]
MNGTNTKYLKNDGRISWEYHCKAEGLRFSKSSFVTKFEASKALGAARHQQGKGSAHIDDTRTLAEYLDYWLDNHAALRCSRRPWSDTASSRSLWFGCSGIFRFAT